MTYEPKGITLLVAVILSSVVLTVALALLDITYKQYVLSSAAKQSQYAFYSADALLECALYYDQQLGSFNPNGSGPGTISCFDHSGNAQSAVVGVTALGSGKKFTFTIPCTGGGAMGTVTVFKMTSGTCNGTHSSCVYATGYSVCNASDIKRVERGLSVSYGL